MGREAIVGGDDGDEEGKWPAMFAARDEIFWSRAVMVGRVGDASLIVVE